MKLAFSNIAWDPAEEAQVLPILQQYGFTGIEVAPTKFWPDWESASLKQAKEIAEIYKEQGFVIPALQSVLFGKPDLQVFGSPKQQQQLKNHLGFIADLANAFGAKAVVFGSPKNRDPGDRTPEQAMDEAICFFNEVAPYFSDANSQLVIEANPKYYNCNFVSHWQEARSLVKQCDHPGIGLHFDLACTQLAGDSPMDAVAEVHQDIRHFHISQPDLSPFSSPLTEHEATANLLKNYQYSKFCSVEMRRSEDPLKDITQAARFASQIY